VKRLHVPNNEDYLREVQVFEKLGIEKKDALPNHLISLQLTFKHGRDFFLMFPWADGNLKQFWSQTRLNPTEPESMCWFFEQISGIARGLRKIHHLGTQGKTSLDADNAAIMVLSPSLGDREWGRHGDIKPENILWFKEYDGQPNYLVISDFGLTQFNTAHSKSKVLQEQIQGFSGTYRPPDLHLDESISQRYDIWSLGCVILEFTSWLLLGYNEGIETFMKERLNDDYDFENASEDKFFNFKKTFDGARSEGKITSTLKPSVIKAGILRSSCTLIRQTNGYFSGSKGYTTQMGAASLCTHFWILSSLGCWHQSVVLVGAAT
jgi:serine/threonine protein kinase